MSWTSEIIKAAQAGAYQEMQGNPSFTVPSVLGRANQMAGIEAQNQFNNANAGFNGVMNNFANWGMQQAQNAYNQANPLPTYGSWTPTNDPGAYNLLRTNAQAPQSNFFGQMNYWQGSGQEGQPAGTQTNVYAQMKAIDAQRQGLAGKQVNPNQTQPNLFGKK